MHNYGNSYQLTKHLQWAWLCAKCFTGIISLNIPKNEVGSITIPLYGATMGSIMLS